MSDPGKIGFWSADVIQGNLHIYTPKLTELRALLLLELEEEGKHVPFLYPDDELGIISLETILSENIILNGRNYRVVKGMYHSDIVDWVSSSVEVIPLVSSVFLLGRPHSKGDYWAGGRFFVDAMSYQFEDNNGKIIETALQGNCYVAEFELRSSSLDKDINLQTEIVFEVNRVVNLEHNWDTIDLEISERTVFSGSTYAEPMVLNAIQSSWIFFTENALECGTVLLLVLYLAFNRFMKRRKPSKSNGSA